VDIAAKINNLEFHDNDDNPTSHEDDTQ